jgi:hypothetical protein
MKEKDGIKMREMMARAAGRRPHAASRPPGERDPYARWPLMTAVVVDLPAENNR